MRQLIVLSAILSLGLAVGCGKKDDPTVKTPDPAKPGAATARATNEGTVGEKVGGQIDKAVDKTGAALGKAENKVESAVDKVVAKTTATLDRIDYATGRTAALKYLPADAFAAVSVYPQLVFNNALTKDVPWDEVFAEMIKRRKFDPRKIEQVHVFVPTPAPTGPPAPVPTVVVRFTEVIDTAGLMEQIFEEGSEKVEAGGKVYYRDKTARAPIAIFMPDDRTLVGCMVTDAAKLLDAKGSTGPLNDRIKAGPTNNVFNAVVLLEPVRPTLDQLTMLGKSQMPEAFQPFADIPANVDVLTAAMSLDGPMLLSIHLESKNEAAATKIQGTLQGGLAMLKGIYGLQREQLAKAAPPEAAPLLTLADEVVGGLEVQTKGALVSVNLATPKSLPKVGEAMGAMIESARKSALKARASNNLRQIMFAMLAHNDSTRKLPTNSYDADGKPLLSWRVHILPFVEQRALYDQFKLDEPWDSEHNRKLAAQMPQVYRSVNAAPDTDKTPYQTFSGEGTAFEPKKALTITDVRDGMSNTIAVVEVGADKAVVWTKPEDVPLQGASPVAALGTLDDSGFLVGFLDGSVMRLPKTIKAETLKAMISPAGGETIDRSELQPGR